MSLAPVTIPLSSPITSGGKTFDTLTIRESKLSDLIAMEDIQGSPLSRFAVLLSRLADVPEDVVHELAWTDLRRIQTEAAAYLGNGGEDGETSPS